MALTYDPNNVVKDRIMTLIEQIRADQLAARKMRDAEKTSILTTLMGEAISVGKKDNREPTDEEVVQVVKKFVKNLNEVVALTSKPDFENQTKKHLALFEIETLAKYVPPQLTADQIHLILKEFYPVVEKTGKQRGIIMKFLNAQYPGQFDGATASDVVAGYLK